MKRTGLTWLISSVVFCLAALTIITIGATQSELEPLRAAVSSPPAQTALPSVDRSQTALIPSRPAFRPGQGAAPTGSTDFVYRFADRHLSDQQPVDSVAQAAPSAQPPSYQPIETIYLADPSNYGERYRADAYGQPANHQLIVVLHETVGSALSAINLFQTPHVRDEDQISYHTLIDREGTVIYIVPPELRAFGAGSSVFNGPSGAEAVVTNPALPGSVNNFAYHVSLETPTDGRGNGQTHSGYTEAQYRSLAWLLARSTVPDRRITTHRQVDRSGTRIDPRSFDFDYFLTLLHQYPHRLALAG